MRIQLIRTMYANSMREAQERASEYLINQYGFHPNMQAKVNFVSYYGEEVGYQVRLYDSTTNNLMYAFWFPVSPSSISTAEKILRESDHNVLLNAD